MKCKGKTQSGGECNNDAMTNGFCRLHGGSNEEKRPGDERDREKLEAIARFDEREKRSSNMGDFNTKLGIDLVLFNELHPGMVPRWVKDQGARLAQFYNTGWIYVPHDPRITVGDNPGGNTDMADRVSVIAGTDSSKAEGAYRLVLMMIPEEIHARIVAKKKVGTDETEDMIYRNLEGNGDAQVEKSYRPESGERSYQP